jgi:glyoxylase-like metal-dependent hydrolase (beta-lactamase superfamily II)
MLAIAAGAALALCAVSALAQPPAPAPMAIQAAKPGVYMVAGKGSNTTVVVGQGGLVLVDTKNPGQANFDELNAVVRKVSPLPVKEAIVTHHHPDHAGNAGLFQAAGVPVAGSAALVEALKSYKPANGGPVPAPPNVTFTGSLTQTVAGVTVRMDHRPGHTGDDVIAYFPALKLLAAGDQVEETPGIDYSGGGTLYGWVASLDAMAALDFDQVIPGHGPRPMTRAEFLAFRQSAHTFVDRAKAAVKSGVPKDKLLASIKSDDLGWPITTPAWTAPVRLDGLYAELSK